MDIIYTVFGSAVADEVGLFNPQETVNIGAYKIQTGAAEMPGQNFNITIWKTDEH
jgi:hypothetical protein